MSLSALFEYLDSSSHEAKQVSDIVPIEQWLESPFYSGEDGVNLYDFWKVELADFFNSRSAEWIIYGCFVGSTKVALLEGGCATMEDLATRYGADEVFWVYSIDESGRIVPGKARNCRVTHDNEAVFKVVLDNGREEFCTSDHLFMLRDGSYKPAIELKPDDSLMPFYRVYTNSGETYDNTPDGYERVYDPRSGHWYTTHRLVGHTCYGQPLIGALPDNQVFHHSKGKRNNTPECLILMDRSSHIFLHRSQNKERWSDSGFAERNRQGRLKAIAEGRWPVPTEQCHKVRLEQRSTEEGKAQCRKSLQDWIEKHPNEYREQCAKNGSARMIANFRNESFVEGHKDRLRARNKNPEFVDKAIKSKWEKLGRSIEQVLEVLSTCCSVNKASKKLGISNSCIYRMLKHYGYPCDSQGLKDGNYLNHKVVSVEFSHWDKVYDLEVEKYHNFALDSGVFVHNSLGGGKSTAAIVSLVRRVYEMSCFDCPPLLFGLLKSSVLYYIYFSISLTQANRTGFGKMIRFIDSIPYFKQYFRRNPNIMSEIQFPFMRMVYGSAAEHQIGLDLYGAALDEGDFYRKSTAGIKEVNQAREIYTKIQNRRATRFTRGKLPDGMSILISSPAYESDYVEKRIEIVNKRNQSEVEEHLRTKVTNVVGYRVTHKQYLGEEFYVHPGSADTDPVLIETRDILMDLVQALHMEKSLPSGSEKFSFRAICEFMAPILDLVRVPMDFFDNFKDDPESAVRDILGRSTRGKMKYMTREQASRRISRYEKHPFSQQTISISTEDSRNIDDFFLEDRLYLPKHLRRWIHIDQSITTDRTGMACVVETASDIKDFTKNHTLVEWMLAIIPPARGQIPIQRCAEFVVFLRNMGYNIVKTTMDTFQSYSSIQYLNASGIKAEHLSVDRDDRAYVELRNASSSGRIRYYYYSIYIDEVSELLWDRSKKKLDHPDKGSKDVSDAVAGAHLSSVVDQAYGLVTHDTTSSEPDLEDEAFWEDL